MMQQRNVEEITRLLKQAQHGEREAWTELLGCTYVDLKRLARHLLAGSAHDVVPPAIAAEWAEKVLNADLKTAEGAVFALAQLGRVTGDRTRDLDDGLRRRIAERLDRAGAAAHLVQMVREQVEWTADDEAQAFGEALPPGLRL